MSIPYNDNADIRAPKPIDARTMTISGGTAIPYASVAAANAAILLAYRCQYLTVWVLMNSDPTLYWYRASTADIALEPKEKESYTLSADGSITLNPPYRIEGIVVLPTNNITNLQVGTTSGGIDLEPGSGPITAGSSYTLNYFPYITTATPIFFTGITTGTKIIVYKKF